LELVAPRSITSSPVIAEFFFSHTFLPSGTVKSVPKLQLADQLFQPLVEVVSVENFRAGHVVAVAQTQNVDKRCTAFMIFRVLLLESCLFVPQGFMFYGFIVICLY
jgi:hypothetical protein